MKLISPDYYPLFKCTAGACLHTCCAGWEIDIDEDSLSRYGKVSGEIGKRLENNIEDGHFILDEAERCPFLNERNLCDLIIALGEDSLCRICADHPRFRNFLSDRTEIGLGLTCEEAARLILTRKEPLRLVCMEDDGISEELSEDEKEVLGIRDGMLSLICDRSLPVSERVSRLQKEYDVTLPDLTLSEWADVYLSLERLDHAWTHKLESVKEKAPAPCADEIALEQLMAYLVFRHLLPAAEDGDIEGRLAFIVLSWKFIRALGDDILENARMYSSEIEYSDENIGVLMDACFA